MKRPSPICIRRSTQQPSLLLGPAASGDRSLRGLRVRFRPRRKQIIRHSILTSRPETTASWTLITDGLRCNAGDQKDWKKLRAPSSPFNEQRKAAPISQENSRIPRGWLIRKARHWRAFLRVLGTFPLSAGLLGLGGRIRTLRWWIGI